MTSSLMCREPRELVWSVVKYEDDGYCRSDRFSFGGYKFCYFWLWNDPVRGLYILTLNTHYGRSRDFFYTVSASVNGKKLPSDDTRRCLLRSCVVRLWECEVSYIRQILGESPCEYSFRFEVRFYDCEESTSSSDTRKGDFFQQRCKSVQTTLNMKSVKNKSVQTRQNTNATDKCVQTTLNTNATDKCVETTLNMNATDKCVQTTLNMNAVSCLEKLSENFGKLMEEGSPQDVVLKCGDHTVRVQRNILCSRSPVFAAMLRRDMEEDNSGLVQIRDMDGDVFQQFIRYIYTGMLPELTVDDARRLYVAADQYEIDELRKRCAEFLTDNLTSDNACDLLVLADTHSDLNFKEDVIIFIVNKKVYLKNEQWLAFCDGYPRLANIVLNRSIN